MFAIRADGSPDIGMGHIMRCLSLASEIKAAGQEVSFISKFSEGIQKITDYGFDVICLNKQEYPPEQEITMLVEIIKEHKIKTLIIDTYNVSRQYFLEIKKYINVLVYIDDINSFTYPVDILNNGNVAGEYLDYAKYSPKEIMLLGPKYNLIREEFKDLPDRKINKKVNSIMITTGGSDPYDLSSYFAELIANIPELGHITINLVVGNLFKNIDALYKLSKKYKQIKLHENVKRMSEIMLDSDLAISAGGSTIYELCACGTPTLAFIMADNQENATLILEKKGYVKNLGWYKEFKDNEVKDSIIKICNNELERMAISRKMQSLLDGKGAYRVANEIIRMSV